MEEETDKYCYYSDLFRGVLTQLECQSKCEAISTCPGISYSSKAGQSHCYVCKRDDLSSAANDYGFFRNGNYYGKFYTGTFIHVLYSTAIGKF